MGERGFRYSMLGLLAAVLLSSTSFPGALIGFMFGVAIAFFVAGPSFLAAAALQQVGMPITPKGVALILIAIYGLMFVAALSKALRAGTITTNSETRLAWFRVALLGALPMIGWLSSQALVRAWP